MYFIYVLYVKDPNVFMSAVKESVLKFIINSSLLHTQGLQQVVFTPAF